MKIQNLQIVKNETIRFSDDVFSYNHNRHPRWLQQLCFWLLRKMRCHHYEVTTKLNTVELNIPNIKERIYKLLHQYNQLCCHRPEYIVCGAADLEDLLKGDTYDRAISIDKKYLGYKLIIVPWIKGCFILPTPEDTTKL